MRWRNEAWLAQALLVVHGLAGDEIGINMRAITTIGAPGVTMVNEANCQVSLVGNKFVTTKESCQRVLELVAMNTAAASPTGGFLDGK
jgi:hypothetical protein